jgi:opacity protein-like surface antigen
MAVLVSLACFGQENQRVQVFAGYSFQHLSTGDVSGAGLDTLFGVSTDTFTVHKLMSGADIELQYNFTSHFGAVVDVSGHTGKPVTASSSSGFSVAPRADSFWFLAGPEAQAPKGRFTLFAHVLIGKNRLRSNSSEAVNFYGTAGSAISDSSLAAGAGGGVDWQVKKHFAVRLGQVDYFYTRHTAADYASALFGTSVLIGTSNFQNNLRFSAGIVYHFGNW